MGQRTESTDPDSCARGPATKRACSVWHPRSPGLTALCAAAIGVVAAANRSDGAQILGVAAATDAAANSFQFEAGSLRFDGGSTDAGRVQILHKGVWGTVCARQADARTVAAVACRQLGFGAATGTMQMPSSGEGPIWLRSVRCSGHEARLTQCEHNGFGADARNETCGEALGVRCLACTDDACSVYTAPVTVSGALSDSADVAPAFYGAAAAGVDMGLALHMQCSRRDNQSRISTVDCQINSYGDSRDVHEQQKQAIRDADDEDDSILEGLPDPFRPESAQRAYIYGEKLQDEYRQRRAALKAFLKQNPNDAASLRALVKAGALQWNEAGIFRQPLVAALNASAREVGLIRQLYLSPRKQIVWDLDRNVNHGNPDIIEASTLASRDPSAARIARQLSQGGLAQIDDYGLDIAALNASVDQAFSNPDPKFTSVASNGASMATRVPLDALAPLLANSTINSAVRAYLGPDAVLDGYKTVRLGQNASGSQNIAGLWHNDRAGNRLKLFIRLHDVDPDPLAGGHPTLVAVGSHDLLHFSIEGYEHSRMLDSFVRSEYTVASLGGKMGSGFLFDTNTLHRGVPEGLVGRTTVVLEYHSAAKCPVIQTLDLPIPCPSGDQHLLTEAEKYIASGLGLPLGSPNYVARTASTASAAVDAAIVVPGAGNQCIEWAHPNEAHSIFIATNEAGRKTILVQSSFLDSPSAISIEDLDAWAQKHPDARVLIARTGCTAQWRFYSFDTMPMDGNTVWLESGDSREGICLLNQERLGRVPFSGQSAGGCVMPGVDGAVFGNFDMLLAFPTIPSSTSTDGDVSPELENRLEQEAQNFRTLVSKHLTVADGEMLANVTGVPLSELVNNTVAAAADPITTMLGGRLIDAVLSAVRFVPHRLNVEGLHLLRVLLAERMDDDRRSRQPVLSDEVHQLRDSWIQNGYLRLDFDKYTSSRGSSNEMLNEVLRMAAASNEPQHTINFAERAVSHVAGDPQYALHIDTFHSVVKMWVYPRNVTAEDGPLSFVPGSHRCSKGKLEWLFARTRDNDPEVVREPSVRFGAASVSGAEAASGLRSFGFEVATPILPFPEFERTLVIADTSGLHCRGKAVPGRSRSALRPMGAENDGGVKRLNPFRGDP